MPELLPFLEEYWRNSVVERGIPSLETNSYPARAPISARPQWRGGEGGPEAALGRLTRQGFDRPPPQSAGFHSLFGGELPFLEGQAAAFSRAPHHLDRQEWV